MWGNSQKYQEEWILVSSLKSGSPILLDPGHPKLYHEAGPVRTLPQAHRTLTCTGVPWTECSIPGTGLGQPLSTRCSWCCAGENPVPFPLLCIPFPSPGWYMEPTRPRCSLQILWEYIWQFQLEWWEVPFFCDRNSKRGNSSDMESV